MKVAKRLALTTTGFVFSGAIGFAGAYELTTHAKLTNAAFNQSRLSFDVSLVLAWGIQSWTAPLATSEAPFRTQAGSIYFDITAGQVYSRLATEYESKALTPDLAPDAFRLNGWLMRGAVREDDGDPLVGLSKREPRDDPIENVNRFCNHFFDPIVSRTNGRGLSTFCPFPDVVKDAAQWALGSEVPFASQPVELVGRRNHFTVLDAREAMWRALTLRGRTGEPISGTVGSLTLSGEDLRRAYWATTFRTLGDVIHSIQDMGQPQHTRNESHFLQNTGYEEHMNDRATRSRFYQVDDQSQAVTFGVLPDLTYGDYPIPRFSRYSDYWSTVVTSGNAMGLADYSNRGFFTLQSNIGNATYPKPLPAASNYTSVRTTDFPGVESSYLLGTVDDDVAGPSESITVSTRSVFSGVGPPVSYTLSTRNYDDRASLLIPRAVAYSAGLLDYFFRGKMEISLPDSRVYAIVDHAAFAGAGVPATDVFGFKGFGKIRVKLRNSTDPITSPNSPAPHTPQPQDMGPGTLVAVAKFHRNACYQDDLSGEPGVPGIDANTCRSLAEEMVVSQFQSVSSVPSGSPQEYEFTFDQEIPINATDLYLQVVFRGALGQEADAVVVATQDISEPTYWALMNAGDYILSRDGHAHLCDGTTNCNFDDLMDGAFQFFLGDTSTTPGAIILVRSMPRASFSRFAFLTDAQPDPQQLYNLTVGNNEPQAWTYQPSQNQWNFRADGSTDPKHTSVVRERNVYNTNLRPVILPPPDGPPLLRVLDPDELSEPLRYPNPLPFFCIKAQAGGCNPP